MCKNSFLKKLFFVMALTLAVVLSVGVVSYASDEKLPLGSSAYYVPVDSTEFKLYVNQSGSLVVAGMNLVDYSSDVTMYASISYKMPDGEMMVQDIRKLNAYKNNPTPCVVFEMDKYYTAFCDLYITFIDSDTLKPYVEPIKVNEYFAISQETYQVRGVLGYSDTDNKDVEFMPIEAIYDADGNYVMWPGEYYDRWYTLRVDDLSLCDEYFMQQVKINFAITDINDYKIISIAPSDIGNVLEINSDQLGAATIVDGDDYVEYYETPESTKSTKIYIADRATEVFLNGSNINNRDLAKYVNMDAKIKFVENTDDKYYDVVLITVYEHGIVEAVDSDDPSCSKLTLSGNKRVYFDFEDEEIIINIVDKYGRDIELSDIKPGDVVAMVVGDDISPDYTEPIDAKNFKDKIKIINLGKNYISGAITEADDEYIYINGTPYSYGDFVDGNYSDVIENGTINLGTEGRFYLSLTGKIIGFDGSDGGNKNYGYILQTNYDDSGFDSGWQIKMLTEDGIDVYDLYTTIELDGAYVKAESLGETAGAFIDFQIKNSHKNNVAARVVEYKLTNDGRIKKLSFLGATELGANSEYRASTYRVGSMSIDKKVVVFDIQSPESAETKVVGISSLVDKSEYSGYMSDKDDVWNVFIVTEGIIEESESDDEIPEIDTNWNYGYILQTNYDDSGFEPGWQIKMLTKDGIGVYELYTTVELNGAYVKAESLGKTAEAFIDFQIKNSHQKNVDARIVEFKLTNDGRIKNLTFTYDATQVAKDEFNKSLNKIDGKILAEDVVIFDIESPDANGAEVYDISYLVDECEYAGIVAAKDDEWNVFVMTECPSKLDVAAGLMYVESVSSVMYGYEDAVKVNYYTNGDSTLKSAIFVYTEAFCLTGDDYSSLSKGDIFIANINSEGLVSEYAIVAELSSDELILDDRAIDYLENADEDVAFAYGYIEDIDKRGNVVLSCEYITPNSYVDIFNPNYANQYHFNVKVKKPTVEVGVWDKNGVDAATNLDGECYYMFVTFYDGEPVDVYSIGYERDIPYSVDW